MDNHFTVPSPGRPIQDADAFSPSRWNFLAPVPERSPRRRPNEAHFVRGLFEDALRHHRAGRISQAVTRYKRVLSLRPGYADAHNNLGVAYVTLGRVIDAIAHYKRAIALCPDHGNAHSNLGTALVSVGRYAEAIPHYEHALGQAPGNPETYYNLGIALTGDGRAADAIARYQKALFLRNDFAEAHNNLANLFASQGDTEQAIAHYRRALEINPTHANSLNNLGNAYRDLGRFDEALEQYDRAISIRPVSAEAHYNRAEIRKFRAGDADLEALEALARRADLPVAKAPYIHFALARALEDTGDYGRSFEQLRRGNELKRGQIHYDERAVADLLRRIPRAFTRELLESAGAAAEGGPAPVFIVGMPRSGSSLIEQILASHPQVHGAGELGILPGCIPADFPETFAALGAEAVRAVGEAYLSRLPAMPEGKTVLTDKLPDNFLRIGAIRMMFPNARIIHTVRNPIDTCISCYSKLFSASQPFTYELGELGRYYRRYHELMGHWESVLPEGAMLRVAYEDVVGDLETEARRLVAYCGLEWDERCLEFYKTARTVKTASAVQVRQPIFRTSVNRWRRYEAGLGALLRELGGMIPAQMGAGV